MSEKTPKPEFNLKPVKEKPVRQFKKGSKYDYIIDAFIEQKNPLVEVGVPNKDANYVRNALNKRIEVRRIKNLKVSTVNDKCYLEIIKPEKKAS